MVGIDVENLGRDWFCNSQATFSRVESALQSSCSKLARQTATQGLPMKPSQPNNQLRTSHQCYNPLENGCQQHHPPKTREQTQKMPEAKSLQRQPPTFRDGFPSLFQRMKIRPNYVTQWTIGIFFQQTCLMTAVVCVFLIKAWSNLAAISMGCREVQCSPFWTGKGYHLQPSQFEVSFGIAWIGTYVSS